MSQPLNTSSLFQNSLRQWQAEWKARHESSNGAPAVARRLVGASKTKRLGRQRSRQPQAQ